MCDALTVAESMLSRGQIDFLHGSVLTVSLPPPVTNKEDYHKPPAVDQDNSTSGSILLSNIPRGTKEDTLFMFLENRRRCDGGPIKSLEYDESRQTATVTFEDHQSEFGISINRLQRIKSRRKKPLERRKITDLMSRLCIWYSQH